MEESRGSSDLRGSLEWPQTGLLGPASLVRNIKSFSVGKSGRPAQPRYLGMDTSDMNGTLAASQLAIQEWTCRHIYLWTTTEQTRGSTTVWWHIQPSQISEYANKSLLSKELCRYSEPLVYRKIQIIELTNDLARLRGVQRNVSLMQRWEYLRHSSRNTSNSGKMEITTKRRWKQKASDKTKFNQRGSLQWIGCKNYAT